MKKTNEDNSINPLVNRYEAMLLETMNIKNETKIMIADEEFNVIYGGTVSDIRFYLHGENVYELLIKTPHLSEIFFNIARFVNEKYKEIGKVVILDDLVESDNGIFADKWVMTSAYFYQLVVAIFKGQDNMDDLNKYLRQIGGRL